MDIGVVQPTASPVPDPGGYADATSQQAFCADTVCWIEKIYDQSPMHNDLTQAPRGNFSGPAMGGANNLPLADMAPVTVMGHKVYGAFIEPGMGLRNNNPIDTAVDDQAEGTYWVIDGHHYNDGCCFDYGNAEIDSRDDGNGTMETAYFGNETAWYHGSGSGPWIMTDQENNLVGCANPGSTSKLCANLPSVGWRFVTAIAKGEPHHWTTLGADSQKGPLAVMFDGPRIDSSYDPMRKQGAIVLGNGGDNSNGAAGTFYEGTMTAGFPSDNTDQLVQANIAAAHYDVPRVALAPGSAAPTASIGRVSGKFGNAEQLNGTSSNRYVSLPAGIASGLHDFTIAAWVNPASVDTWARVFDFGSSTTNYMFLTVSPGTGMGPRFAITTGGNGAAEQQLTAPAPLPSGQWTLLAVTLSGTTGTLYVNGVPVATNTSMTLNPASLGTTTNNWIGRSQFGSDPYLNADVDEFQIYDRALSQSEVLSLLSSAGGTPGGGDVAWYRFDEAGGATALDASGKGHDAAIVAFGSASGGPSAPTGLQTFAPGTSRDVTVTFTNTTGSPAAGVALKISAPEQWTSVVKGTHDTTARFNDPIPPGVSVNATFTVSSATSPFNGDLVATARWTNTDTGGPGSDTAAERVRNVSPVKINEFRTASTGNSTNSFIELYNAGSTAVDMSGWTLTEHPTQQPIFSTVKIPAGTTLAAGGFYLLGLSDSGLAKPAKAGDTTIDVRDATGLLPGQPLTIGSGPDAETATVLAPGTAATSATTLWQPLPEGPITIPAGSTNVPVASTSGFAAGQQIALGYGSDYEVATVTAVGNPGAQARLAAEAPAGSTNIKVTSTTSIAAGDKIRLDIASRGHGIEWVTVTAVGTSGASGTGLTLAEPLKYDHASNLPFSDWGTGISFSPATKFAHSSNEPVQALGSGVTLVAPLTKDHAINDPVRDSLVGVTGYQGTTAPDQWFGGPALSSSAGTMVLRDAAGRVADSLNYGGLVDPWAAEGYQGASGTGQSGCFVPAPSTTGVNGQSAGRYPDGADTDSNCSDFKTSSTPSPRASNQ